MTNEDNYTKLLDRLRAITKELSRLHEEMIELGYSKLWEDLNDE